MKQMSAQNKSLLMLVIALTGVIIVLICLFLPYFTYTYSIPLAGTTKKDESGLSLISSLFSQEGLDGYNTIKTNYSDELASLDIDIDKIAVGYVFVAVGAFSALALSFVVAILLGLSIILNKKGIFLSAKIVSFVTVALAVITVVGVAMLVKNLTFAFDVALVLVFRVTCSSTYGASGFLFLAGAVLCSVALLFVDFSQLGSILKNNTDDEEDKDENENEEEQNKIEQTP